MLKTVSLHCENCSANLKIHENMSKFSCGYCGASQIVERTGGTVSLKMVDAIRQVQTGTDKTAAELAIKRLGGELIGIENTTKRYKRLKENELSYNIQKFVFIWIGAFMLVVIFSIIVQGTFGLVLFIVLITASTIAVMYFLFQQKTKIENKWDSVIEKNAELGRETKQKIAKNRALVD